MANETQTKAKAGAVIVPVTLFEQNCTVIWCEATKKAVVIDPGGDVPKILAAIKQTNVSVEKIWLTHGHIDHVGGAAELRDALKVPIEGPHIADKHLLDNVVTSAARFLIPRWLLFGGGHFNRVHLREVARAPVANAGNDRNEAFTLARQPIFDLGRNDAVILAVDQALLGERL